MQEEGIPSHLQQQQQPHHDPRIMWSMMLLHMQVGERLLDFNFIRQSAMMSLDALRLLGAQTHASKRICHQEHLRQDFLAGTVNVRIRGFRDEPYDFTDEDDSPPDDKEDEWVAEFTYRHPGQHASQKETTKWSDVTTKCSKLLWAIDLVTSEQEVCSLQPTLQFQMAVRIDETEQCIYYDCFDHTPNAVDWKHTLPSKRAVQAFNLIVNPPEEKPGGYDTSLEDGHDEAFEAFLDGDVDMPEDTEILRRAVHLQAILGECLNSRVFRLKVPFSSISGMLLRASTQATRMGVFVLELFHPADDFCVRHVGCRYEAANAFHQCSDWSVETVASRARRHYIYADMEELAQLAAHLCHADPRLEGMMSSARPAQDDGDGAGHKRGYRDGVRTSTRVIGHTNSLFDADPFYAGSPSHRLSLEPLPKPTPPLTTQQVDDMLVNQGLVTREQVSDMSLCLKASILHGHSILMEDTTPESILCTGKCYSCGSDVPITWEDAIRADPLLCPSCDAVNCMSQLCHGRIHLDAKMVHAHCNQCPDFGRCSWDFRDTHCDVCGEHYFRGSTGYSCPSCGGGSRRAEQVLNDLKDAKPTSGSWTGRPIGEELAKDLVIADETYHQAVVLGALRNLLAPDAGQHAANPDLLVQFLRVLAAAEMEDNVAAVAAVPAVELEAAGLARRGPEIVTDDESSAEMDE